METRKLTNTAWSSCDPSCLITKLFLINRFLFHHWLREGLWHGSWGARTPWVPWKPFLPLLILWHIARCPFILRWVVVHSEDDCLKFLQKEAANLVSNPEETDCSKMGDKGNQTLAYAWSWRNCPPLALNVHKALGLEKGEGVSNPKPRKDNHKLAHPTTWFRLYQYLKGACK